VKADFMAMNEKKNKLQASLVFIVTGLRIIAGEENMFKN